MTICTPEHLAFVRVLIGLAMTLALLVAALAVAETREDAE